MDCHIVFHFIRVWCFTLNSYLCKNDSVEQEVHCGELFMFDSILEIMYNLKVVIPLGG
jgi:hypothetical protein